MISGVSTNHSAEAISITHPHAPTQVKLFSSVLDNAGVGANEVDYVEMHGTGTQAGDSIETSAVAEVMSTRSRNDRPMYIGTVKPNIGHGESVSGVASIIKSVLMFKKSMIPPHVGIKDTINPAIPTQKLDSLNIRIPRTKVPFCNDGRPRRILVNNFNAAGGNTSLLLEEYTSGEQEREAVQHPHPCHVVTVSGKTKTSLRENTNRLISFLSSQEDIQMADLAYSSTARQIHHPLRQAYTASDVPQLIASLKQGLSQGIEPSKGQTSPVFVFSGQGSLYQGMGSQLYSTCKTYADKIREIDELCCSLELPPVLPLFEDATFDPTKGSSLQGQLMIVATGIALATLWRSWGVSPRLVCGHSLGEYAALCISGVLSLHDTFWLLGQRGKLIEQFCQQGTHAMLAVSMSQTKLQRMLLSESFSTCEIACLNGPESMVVSGPVESIMALRDSLSGLGVRTHALDLPYAFHSAQLDPCLELFSSVARKVRFNKPTIPVASTCEARIVTDTGVFGPEYLARQARRPVQFQSTIENILTSGESGSGSLWFIDIGARPLCLPMVKSIAGVEGANTVPSVTPKEEDWATLSKSVSKLYEAGLDIDWSSFHREHERNLRFVPLPSYAFDLKSHWLQYQGDWLITKSSKESTLKPKAQEKLFSPTATLQRIEREEFTDERSHVTFVSDLNEKHLRAIVSGHLVNKVALCPSSVYADMALTAASYIWKRNSSEEIPGLDLSDIEVHKPLILSGMGEQPVFIKATKDANSNSVSLTISSIAQDRTDQAETVHVTCNIHYGSSSKWMSQWAKQKYLIQSRIDSLQQASLEGDVHRLKRGMAYKLFAGFVDYSQPFQGMQEVLMDSEQLEGSAQIRCQPVPTGQDSMYPPYWIDGLIHLSGFILNVSEAIPDDIVYISHGWGSMRIVSPFSEQGNYRAYVRMQDSGKKDIMSGDVYVLDQDKNCVIAVVEDVKFQAIKKRILSLLLPSPGTETKSSFSAPLPQPTSKAVHRPQPREEIRSSQDVFSRVIDLIAEETGVPSEELTDDTNLEDVGLDSLISLSLVDKIRQTLTISIPSSAILTCTRLADLRSFFGSPDGDDAESSTSSEASDCLASDSGYTTPLSAANSEAADPFLDILSKIIASESGVDVEEVTSGTSFACLGIDSLLGLSIIDTVYTQTGRRLASSFFLDHMSYADVEKTFGPPAPKPSLTSGDEIRSRLVSRPSCTSVLLQGDPSVTGHSMFLLPDGSGSAGSYAGLPSLSNTTPHGPTNVKVWGLNSPFLGSSEPFDVSFREMAGMYVDEILRINPEGPICLGGW